MRDWANLLAARMQDVPKVTYARLFYLQQDKNHVTIHRKTRSYQNYNVHISLFLPLPSCHLCKDPRIARER